jgi:hypothetical protein
MPQLLFVTFEPTDVRFSFCTDAQVSPLIFSCTRQVFATMCFSPVFNYSFHSYSYVGSPFSLIDKFYDNPSPPRARKLRLKL